MSGVYYLGIDPGINGALALVDTAGELHDVVDMPTRVAGTRANGKEKRTVDEDLLTLIVMAWMEDDFLIGVIERVQASPGAGAVSMFSFGEGYGKIQGVLSALGISCELVTPKEWKTHFDLGKDKKDSLAKARSLWPNYAESFARVKDADRAEAALIALHCMTKDQS